jgi:hypothetical protein
VLGVPDLQNFQELLPYSSKIVVYLGLCIMSGEKARISSFSSCKKERKGEKKGRVSTNQRAPVGPKHQAAMVHSALGENSKT